METHELLTKKKEVLDEARAIHTRVFAEQGGEWRGDEEAKWSALVTKAEGFQAEVERIVRMERAEKDLTEIQEPQRRRTEPNQLRNVAGKPTAADAELAFRGWLLGGSEEEGVTEAHVQAAQRTGVNMRSGKLTMKLPPPLRSLAPRDIAAWEQRAAMGVGSGAVGLYTAPDSPMGALEMALLRFGGMRQAATVFRTATGTDLPFPLNDDTSNKGAILAENTQVSEVDPTFGSLVMNSFKYSSKLVLVARELLQDSSINVSEFISNILGKRIGRIQNDHFTTGDASSKPNGVVTAATLGATATGLTATITYDLIMDLIHSLEPDYRDNGARFMFHDGGLKMIKKTKVLQYSGDTSGAPLWQPSLIAGEPDRISGYPYTVNQSMTTPATSVKSILFGDFSKYLIRDAGDIRLVRMDERYADYDQVGFTAFMRSDGDLLDAGTHPVRYLIQG